MSTNLLEPKKSKRKRISLMMDWVLNMYFMFWKIHLFLLAF